MKKSFFKVAVIVMMSLGMMIAVTACQGSPKDIAIESGNMPQVVFVQGNELDLSKGKLTADGKTIPLDSQDIEVVGYDKDKTGSQTLTISYRSAQTTLTVTVVPRVQTAEKYVYFVGEPIDAVPLRLKITKDDGTSFTTAFGDDGLTVENFNSAEERETLTLTANCQKDGAQYSGTFDVSVVVPQVTFKKPRKTEYGNHETELDWLGSSLTLKSPDGKTVRSIDVDRYEVSGFDPDKVTEENPYAEETVTVSYLGQKVGEFAITVTYSDVSAIRKIAADLKTIDWAHYEFPENGKLYCPAGVTDAQGESAMKALKLYYGLSNADAKLITQNELDAIARLAVVYGYNRWTDALGNAFENVFTLDISDGTLALDYDCKSLADVQRGYLKLTADAEDRDEETALVFAYSDLLTSGKLAVKCENTIVYRGATMNGAEVDLTVGDLVTLVFDQVTLDKIADVLDGLLTVSADLETVPNSWNVEDLNQYRENIEAAYKHLNIMSGNPLINDSAYAVLDELRQKHDFFEILYRYYYSVFTTGEKQEADDADKKIDGLIEIRLPEQLEELSVPFLYAYIAQTSMQTIANNLDYTGANEIPDLVESTWFMYFYKQAIEGAEELIALNDDLYLELYQRTLVPVLEILQTDSYGYYDLNGTSAFNGAYKKLWDQYLYLFEKFEEDPTYADSAEFGPLVEEMFGAFVALKPNQQYHFIRALNYLYYYDVPQIALFPDENGLYSEFASFIYSHYLNVFGVQWDQSDEDMTYDVFTDLLLAIESYAGSDVDTFCTIMADLKPKYENWSGNEKDRFNAKLGFVYEQYMDYYKMYHAVTDESGAVSSYEFESVELGEYQAVFDQLSKELSRIYVAQFYLDYADLIGMDIPLYLPFFASYEQVRQLSERILLCGDEEILRAYYYQPYGNSEFLVSSLYQEVYDATGYFNRYLALLGIDADEYENAKSFRSFLANTADYLWSSAERLYPEFITNSGNEFVFNRENINALMAEYRRLSSNEQELFLALDSMNLYYGGLEGYFGELLKDRPNAAQLAVALLNLEIGYISYQLYPEGIVTIDGKTMTTLEFVSELWSEIKNAYAVLSDDEKQAFDNELSEVYAYYQTVCEALIAQN